MQKKQFSLKRVLILVFIIVLIPIIVYVLQPSTAACGNFINNARTCPIAGYTCQNSAMADVGASCTKKSLSDYYLDLAYNKKLPFLY